MILTTGGTYYCDECWMELSRAIERDEFAGIYVEAVVAPETHASCTICGLTAADESGTLPA